MHGQDGERDIKLTVRERQVLSHCLDNRGAGLRPLLDHGPRWLHRHHSPVCGFVGASARADIEHPQTITDSAFDLPHPSRFWLAAGGITDPNPVVDRCDTIHIVPAFAALTFFKHVPSPFARHDHRYGQAVNGPHTDEFSVLRWLGAFERW